MRYFAFDLKLKKEDIRSTTVNLKDYSYDGPIEAITTYIFKTLSNGNTFVIYREEEVFLKSMYAIDEKIRQPKEALDEILSLIEYALGNKVKITEASEITMLEFDTNLAEAKRRGLAQYWSRVIDQAAIKAFALKIISSTKALRMSLSELRTIRLALSLVLLRVLRQSRHTMSFLPEVRKLVLI